MNIYGKHFVVTGGSAGIGWAISSTLLAKGAKVSILDINLPENIEANYFHCDISDSKSVDCALSSAFKDVGNVDCLINNAGVMSSEPLVNIFDKQTPYHSLETWQNVININLTGSFLVGRAVASHMVRNRIQGLIINVSSICAEGNIGQTAYSASKAGVESMSKVWAKELNPLGIRCCCLAPGFVETQGMKAALQDRVLESWLSKVPLKRLASTDELVHGVLFLISNDFFNGKTLSLDGGLSI